MTATDSADAPQDFPFTLDEVLEQFSPLEEDVVWGEDEEIPASVAGTSSRLRIELQLDAEETVEVVRATRNAVDTNDPVQCTDHLRAMVSVKLSTGDGALNETFSAVLRAHKVESAVILTEELEVSELGGSLELTTAEQLLFSLGRREDAEVALGLTAIVLVSEELAVPLSRSVPLFEQ